jgi:hypothetical protein
MAKLIPSGVVQLPNFAELQYNLNERERQKQLEFDEFASRFDKKAGTYLDGDREAVQQAYGEVEKAMTSLATDPDNVNLRRKLRESYAGYNQVAGTAQFLADNYRQQWSAYNTNPDQFSLGGESAMDVFNRERTTKRDANQILSMASNPFTLAPKYKYDMQSPTQIADEALNNFRKNINDYIKTDGSIDQDKAREYIENYMSARYVDPSQVKNAIIYEGVREGIVGRNGELTSRADLDIIDTEGFAPQRDRLAQKYSNDAVEAFMAAAPKMGVNRAELDLQRQKLAIEREKLSAKQRENKYFGIDPAPYAMKAGGQTIADGYMIPIDFAPVKSKGGSIVKFGKLNGQPYVIEEQKVKELVGDEQVTVVREKQRPATQSDLSLLRQATDGISDSYFKVLPSSQTQRRSAAQAAASGQLDIKGAESALLGVEEQPSGDGVWSEEMFGESQFGAPRVATIPGITIVD